MYEGIVHMYFGSDFSFDRESFRSKLVSSIFYTLLFLSRETQEGNKKISNGLSAHNTNAYLGSISYRILVPSGSDPTT